MNTTTARPIRRPRKLADHQPLRFTAELRAFTAALLPDAASNAMHDFLVPNPRPDLTANLQTPAAWNT